MWRLLVAAMLTVLYLAEGWAFLAKHVWTYCEFPREWCDSNSRIPTKAGSASPRSTIETASPVRVEQPPSHGLNGSARITPLAGTLTMTGGRLMGATLETA
jgi:hypothetical protein